MKWYNMTESSFVIFYSVNRHFQMSQNSCAIRDFSSTNSMRPYSHQKLQCGELTVALSNADII